MDNETNKPRWERTQFHLGKESSALTPFRTINEPWKAREARYTGSFSGVALCISYAMSAFSVWGRKMRIDTLIGSDPNLIASSHVGLAIGALALTFLMRKSESIAPPTICLIWSILELFRPLTYTAVGHSGFWPLALLSASCAVMALRGSMYSRRNASKKMPSLPDDKNPNS